jgi:hypothetical protein
VHSRCCVVLADARCLLLQGGSPQPQRLRPLAAAEYMVSLVAATTVLVVVGRCCASWKCVLLARAAVPACAAIARVPADVVVNNLQDCVGCLAWQVVLVLLCCCSMLVEA